jgi:hypothetical protein
VVGDFAGGGVIGGTIQVVSKIIFSNIIHHTTLENCVMSDEICFVFVVRSLALCTVNICMQIYMGLADNYIASAAILLRCFILSRQVAVQYIHSVYSYKIMYT